MAVERDELRPQLADLVDEVVYDLGLGALAYAARRARRRASPLVGGSRLGRRCGRSDAAGASGTPNRERSGRLHQGRTQVEHPRGGRQVGGSFQVPDDDKLFGHGCNQGLTSPTRR